MFSPVKVLAHQRAFFGHGTVHVNCEPLRYALAVYKPCPKRY